MDTSEKVISISKKDGNENIVVTHVTIRQSIFILILKIVIVELIAAIAIIIFHSFITSVGVRDTIGSTNFFNIPLFIVLVIMKTSLTIYVIFLWIEEYYEITPKEITHRNGFIFKSVEGNSISHLGALEIEQDILGRFFNYGTLKLFNWALEREVTLYLIHNPMKYYAILQQLIPDADKEKHVLREHIIEKDTL